MKITLPWITVLLLATHIIQPVSMGQEVVLGLEIGSDLGWTSQVGKTYQLQYSDDDGVLWHDLGGIVAGDGNVISIFDENQKVGRTYRVLEITSGQGAVTEAVLNTSFEEGVGESATSWTLAGSSAPVRVDSEARTGDYSIHANVVNAGTTPSSAELNQTVSGITAGESYDFSFWVKEVIIGVSYVQQYYIQWLDSTGGVIANTGITSFDSTANSWVEVTDDGLVAPASAVSARIYFNLVTGAVAGGLGEIYLDDISLASANDDAVDETTVVLPVELNELAQLSWGTTIGGTYQLYSSDDLENWSPEGGEINGDGLDYTVDIPTSGSKMFYRLKIDDEFPPTETDIVSLYDADTEKDDEILVETDEALITYMGDRARDRHAREDEFQSYDHYLSWYWEERTLNLEIIDKVAKGGNEIVFNYTTQAKLGAPEFRAFYLGLNTVAEYYLNLSAEEVGVNQYTATINYHERNRRPLAIGDIIELEISQFLEGATNGRDNYYGTTFIYVVGEGVVPWQGIGDIQDSIPIPEKGWLGGLTTLPYQYSDEPDNRFIQTAGNIGPASIQPFMEGRRLHHTDFLDGVHSEAGNPIFPEHVGKLGPQFIEKSCVACHSNNGRSLSPAIGEPLLQGVVKVGSNAVGQAHAILGSVLQPSDSSTEGEGHVSIDSYTNTNGAYGDGTTYTLRKPNFAFSGVTPSHFSVRYSQQLVGLGLLEAIDEQTILAYADDDDADGDGISGRAQVVTDPENGEKRLGRFTHKASQPSLRHQVAGALNTDMGVTTTLMPVLDDGSVTASPEVNDAELEEMNRYISLLGVGARRDLDDVEALRGEVLFNTVGCASCHIPAMTTGPNHPMAELRNQPIQAYTDLLLHDMGEGLADNMGEGIATGAEWRTPPLWNIGFTEGVSGGEAYLHDGRARSLEEAILWHEGEGDAAKESFRTMSQTDRDALIKFLKSL